MFSKFMKLLLILWIFPASVFAVTCESGWDSTAYGCYQFIYIPYYTFFNARSACQTEGGDLVHIQSQAEQDSIFAILPFSMHFWMGLARGTGDFEWLSTGEAVTWTDWASGSPSNLTSRYGALDTNNEWVDFPEHFLLPCICEMTPAGADTTTLQTTTLQTTTSPAVTTSETTTVLSQSPETTISPPTGDWRGAMFVRETYSDDVGTSTVKAKSALACAVLCSHSRCLAFTFDDINKKCLISAVKDVSMEFTATTYT